jgi:subtilase family serine protease
MTRRDIPFLIVLVFLVFSCGSLPALAQGVDPVAYPPIRTKGLVQPAVVGLTPMQIRRAYGFDQLPNRGAGQTIAIVNAYDHPSIEDDLQVFNQTFNLPACTTDNGCFRKIYVGGSKPGANQVWGLETAMDVEWAHATAPDARILLIETKSNLLSELVQAVDIAVQNGATVVTMSWGAYEFANQLSYDSHFLAANTTFVAASGDFGTGVLYPAASGNVVSVGGTTLDLDADGNYLGETAWSGSGGGISAFEGQPDYQSALQLPGNFSQRGVPDVAYNADPDTGFAVFTSLPYYGYKGWIQVAGTSAGPPQWAGLIAIANSSRIQAGKFPLTGSNTSLYKAAKFRANYHDIVAGSNGACGAVCSATPGYDYVTGLGTPQANALVNALVKE